MRAAVVLLLLAGLCACMPQRATIHSARRLFLPKDAAGAPFLKPGLWVERSQDCRFDESASSATWPNCAAWMVVRPSVMITHHHGLPPDSLQTDGFVLSSGYPRVLQLGAPFRQHAWGYDYRGLRPLAVDGAGAIISARLWSVDCELEPSTETPATARRSCLTTTRDQARAAIVAAEGLMGKMNTFRWIRGQEN